jgi:dihydropteroate synthase
MFNKTSKPLIMGVLNVTPDSFSDGGRFTKVDSAVEQAKKMLVDGADVIDIGGESTRPGAESVSDEEQISRVVPVIKTIRQQLSETVLISIDTSLSEVAIAALDAGANIINDISAAQSDRNILSVASEREIPIILMHKKGMPKTMQDNPYYEDVVFEVIEYLKKRVEEAIDGGITRENIIVDPGIGFGKRKQDNIELLANLEKLVNIGYPVLLGTSRKRFMGSICSTDEPTELVTATAVTTALGVMSGVQIFRVHDVKENRQAADVAWAILNAASETH